MPGLLAGFSVLVEYSNLFMVIVTGIYLLVSETESTKRGAVTRLIPYLLGGSIPAVIFFYYNYVNFGSPFTLSYAHAVNYPWVSDFGSLFNFPLFHGIMALLLWGKMVLPTTTRYFNQGVFILSPVLLLAIPGAVQFFRRHRRECLFSLGLFLLYLLLFSKHFTLHGYTSDGRYLTPFLLFLALPAGFFIDRIFSFSGKPFPRSLLLFLVYGLFFLSLRNMIFHIGFSFNYGLDPCQFHRMIAVPDNWLYILDNVFPNALNLPLLWIIEGALLLGIFACSRIRLRHQKLKNLKKIIS